MTKKVKNHPRLWRSRINPVAGFPHVYWTPQGETIEDWITPRSGYIWFDESSSLGLRQIYNTPIEAKEALDLYVKVVLDGDQTVAKKTTQKTNSPKAKTPKKPLPTLIDLLSWWIFNKLDKKEFPPFPKHIASWIRALDGVEDWRWPENGDEVWRDLYAEYEDLQSRFRAPVLPDRDFLVKYAVDKHVRRELYTANSEEEVRKLFRKHHSRGRIISVTGFED